MYDRLKNVLMD